MVFVKQAETEILILQFDQSKIAGLGREHLETSGKSLSAISQNGSS